MRPECVETEVADFIVGTLLAVHTHHLQAFVEFLVRVVQPAVAAPPRFLRKKLKQPMSPSEPEGAPFCLEPMDCRCLQ